MATPPSRSNPPTTPAATSSSGDPRARTERDFLGEREVPEGAYWGVHTARALENFPISGTPVSSHCELVASLGAVKQAAARANSELGLLDADRLAVIDRACQDVRNGLLDEQFVVDVVQGGAGTSTNMNANEVIANRALELLGREAGTYEAIHPLDHVNRSQSTNDVYPTAVRLALLTALDGLSVAVRRLSGACHRKATEFWTVPKVGRTQLQDAVPMTVGQEFAAWAATLAEERRASRTPDSCYGRSTSAPRRSAQGSPPIRRTAKPPAVTSNGSRVFP